MLTERTTDMLREICDKDRTKAVEITPDEAQSILDMISDLRYAGEAVQRAYRQREAAGQMTITSRFFPEDGSPEQRQEIAHPDIESAISRYADIDRGALRR